MLASVALAGNAFAEAGSLAFATGIGPSVCPINQARILFSCPSLSAVDEVSEGGEIGDMDAAWTKEAEEMRRIGDLEAERALPMTPTSPSLLAPEEVCL